MDTNAICTTDVQMFFTAALIDTDIYSIDQIFNKLSAWVRFPSSMHVSDELRCF